MVSRFPRFALLPFLISALAACSDDPAVETDTDQVAGDDTSDDTSDDDDSDGTVSDDDSDESDDSDDSAKVDAGNGMADAGNTQVRSDSGTTPKADAGKSDAATSDAGTKDAGDAVKSDGGSEPVESGDKLKPKCMKKDSQLIMIGDSYITWISHSFPADMVEQSGQTWRMEAVGGYSMGSGGLGLIPPQFDAAIKEDPDAHTVLMSGGGNDVLLADPSLDLLGECQEAGSSMKMNCQKIVSLAVEASSKLMDRMAAAGIRDVVYFFYPHVPANTLISGPVPNEILDYALPITRDFCGSREQATGGKLRCTFIDMVPVFEGQTGVFNTDIHPNNKGSALMAEKVWEVMTDKCIGQKDPKDCCES